MQIARMAWLLAALMLLPAHAYAQDTPAPKDAYLYIISPQDGAIIKGALLCRFGLRNMYVVPAGNDSAKSGHHHLLVDVDAPLDPDEPIPLDKRHIHFGEGETEALIELPPGRHTLQLVLGDAKHYPFKPPITSKKVTIWVAEE
jgi:hypothetical protein